MHGCIISALAEAMNCHVYAPARKLELLRCTGDDRLIDMLSAREKGCPIHLVEMRMIEIAVCGSVCLSIWPFCASVAAF